MEDPGTGRSFPGQNLWLTDIWSPTSASEHIPFLSEILDHCRQNKSWPPDAQQVPAGNIRWKSAAAAGRSPGGIRQIRISAIHMRMSPFFVLILWYAQNQKWDLSAAKKSLQKFLPESSSTKLLFILLPHTVSSLRIHNRINSWA